MTAHQHDEHPLASEVPAAGFEHAALLYGSDEEYLAVAAPFVEEGLQAGEVVSVVTTDHNIALLREALGAASGDVEFTRHVGDDLTPARKIALLHEVRDREEAGGPRSRVLGEALFGATTRERLDWIRYEAILNEVFAPAPQTFLCAYDRRSLPAWVVETASRSHPHLQSAIGRTRSASYQDPSELAREFSRELAPAPLDAEQRPILDIHVDGRMLASTRWLLENLAREASGSADQATEITVGLNEVIANALEHGSDRARVRCWHQEDHLVCEVTDEGPGFDDPLAGYRPPSPEQLDGRGLWIARQTLDVVELQSGEGEGDGGVRAHLAVSV